MKTLNRSIISILRQPIKSTILFLLVLLLSGLIAGSILVRQAIINTDQNLRKSMPAVTTIMQDSQRFFDETGVWPPFEILMPETIREIGNLPQVAKFDYSIDVFRGVTATGLLRWQDLENDMPNYFMYDSDLGIEFLIEGVSNTEFIEIRDGFIELFSGRGFNESELTTLIQPFPVVMASELANINGLGVGSIFDIQIIGFPNIGIGNELIEDRSQEPILDESFSMQIVGIVDPILPEMPDLNDFGAMHQFEWIKARAIHRLYVPNIVAEYLFHVSALSYFNPSNLFVYNFIILNDPMDFEAFAYEVEKLPGYWVAADFSYGFNAISASMESIKDIFDLLLISAIGATILLISLTLLLFLRERKKEVGIYLALGASKKSIFIQMLSEVLPILLMGMVIALFVGNIVADEISTEMLRQNLAHETTGFLQHRQMNQLEHFGYRFELTNDEMLESFEMGINARSTVLFFTLGLGISSLAAIIPITFIIKTNPKKLLLN